MLPDFIVNKIMLYWSPDYKYMNELKNVLVYRRELVEEMEELFPDWNVCHTWFGGLVYVRPDCED